ncbi:protein of unknown function DUF3741 [Dillenia turbinata]|uniref:DUF4378 domain-containing protein n=1 Tax=Dillenia turbinata TaxID=194707 RepID=A0AAN8ZNA9_9MAGN
MEKPFPGCLGRMVNLFDLSSGVPSNRLLSDKPHRDGSPLSRSRSNISRMPSPVADQMEDKLIVSELRMTSSNRKSSGTPMKMLIAQEMSKEIESKHNPPSVVAKLMGLDALPRQPDLTVAPRRQSKGNSRNTLTHSRIPMEYWQHEDGFLDKQMQQEIHLYQDKDECKDVYEIWQQPQKSGYVRDTSPQRRRHNGNQNEKKMALVRQKFIEAKRLATDEKLRQSKEFQDALEVLSTNKDLFLKFLQEPNSLFSQQLCDLPSIARSPETKRITVLRPSKMVDSDRFSASGKTNEKQIKKQALGSQANGLDKSNFEYHPSYTNSNANNNPTQPTRIVVLKPSPGKSHDPRAVAFPPSSSPRVFHGDNIYREPEDEEAQESREVAKEITRQMQENLTNHCRDETLLSSVFSNGYIGDESSFNKSENEYAMGNLCDSEVVTPTSRHSWDYLNRFGSPNSSSSFSRASYSPESSVCREAKKRLSERWAMTALNGSASDQRHVRRSSSTLGEMLALSDVKKPLRLEGDNIKEQDPQGSASCLTSVVNKDERMNGSPRDLLRSKSVPVSSTEYGARLNIDASDPEVGKSPAPKELTKERSTKSSFKGKVSSLFFSRNKKSSKEKSSAVRSKDGSQSTDADADSHGKVRENVTQCDNATGHEVGVSHSPQELPSKTFSLDSVGVGSNEGIISHEAGLSVTKPPGNTGENQDQPSPVSVLDPPFEEDDSTTPEFSGNAKLIQQGKQLHMHPVKSNLIDKSPPIGSIARTQSWDDFCSQTTTQYPLSSPLASNGIEEEEKELLFFIQTLLSAAGLESGVQSDMFITRWHSPESPLDPLLREKYTDLNDKEFLHEAKRRQWRSKRKLVYDCVNAALVDIMGHVSEPNLWVTPGGGVKKRLTDVAPREMADRVWAQMKEWFSGEVKCVAGEGGDSNSLVVERVVRKEVVGKGWVGHMRLEVDNLGKEIEGKLLEELVVETLVELTGRV